MGPLIIAQFQKCWFQLFPACTSFFSIPDVGLAWLSSLACAYYSWFLQPPTPKPTAKESKIPVSPLGFLAWGVSVSPLRDSLGLSYVLSFPVISLHWKSTKNTNNWDFIDLQGHFNVYCNSVTEEVRKQSLKKFNSTSGQKEGIRRRTWVPQEVHPEFSPPPTPHFLPLNFCGDGHECIRCGWMQHQHFKYPSVCT